VLSIGLVLVLVPWGSSVVLVRVLVRAELLVSNPFLQNIREPCAVACLFVSGLALVP
jgi:hypothetical protein